MDCNLMGLVRYGKPSRVNDTMDKPGRLYRLRFNFAKLNGTSSSETNEKLAFRYF